MAATAPPQLTAISSSARQLHSLLRCIAFTSKTLVQISDSGVKFSSYESSVLEAHVLLERKLFSSYRYNADEPPPPFETSLPALLETLQIFSNSTDSSGRDSTRFAPYYNAAKQSAFNSTSLDHSAQLCTLSYNGEGAPLTITMNDTHNDASNFNGPGSVETTCDLTTYEPASGSASEGRDIPFRRNQLAGKIILQSSWLADALAELATTNPERVALCINPSEGFSLAATGPLGSAEVCFDAPVSNPADTGAAKRSFSNPASVTQEPYAPVASAAVNDGSSGRHGGGGGGGVLETFLAQERSRNSYKFAHVRATQLAMKASSKTSVRVDAQGVLSLQFMIELGADGKGREYEGGGAGGGGAGEVSFVDFRFVPLVDDDEGEVEEEDDAGDESDAGSGGHRKGHAANRANGATRAGMADESTASEGD